LLGGLVCARSLSRMGKGLQSGTHTTHTTVTYLDRSDTHDAHLLVVLPLSLDVGCVYPSLKWLD